MRLKGEKPRPIDRDGAESLSLSALAFLAEDVARLTRFMALTGIEPQRLREEAGTPAIQAAVLEHLLGDESLLLTFAANARVAPPLVSSAHQLLAAELGEGQ